MQGLARAVCVKLIKAAENAVSPHPVSTTLGSNGSVFGGVFRCDFAKRIVYSHT